MSKLLEAWILITLVLSGCAALNDRDETVNNYAKFYKAEVGATPSAIADTRAAPATSSPQVVPVATWDTTIASAYARKGYVLIGSSGFTSGRPESDQDAISLGIELGADLVVILSPEYKGSVTTRVPVTKPTTTTSYTNGTATAYGSGGPVMAYGNTTTTTYGNSTTYVPITVQRSAYGAGYFFKKRYRFGALYRDLSDGERQQFQSNRGVYVNSVVDDSPAYNHDILPGDVIVGVNGEVPRGAVGLTELLNENRGRAVQITVIRAGKTLSKEIPMLN